jgi:hypothetical protein
VKNSATKSEDKPSEAIFWRIAPSGRFIRLMRAYFSISGGNEEALDGGPGGATGADGGPGGTRGGATNEQSRRKEGRMEEGLTWCG